MKPRSDGSDSESVPKRKKLQEPEVPSEMKEHSETDSSDEEIGPMPAAPPPKKKPKVLPHEKMYLDAMPDGEMYERSYMHRDVVTHLLVTKTNFVITASCDGHIKFWKKSESSVEFVKHFRAHLGNVQSLAVNASGNLLCSASDEKTLKIFDVVNFDMINMMKLDYVPFCVEFVHSPNHAVAAIAVSDADSPTINVYDARGDNTPLKTLPRLHTKPVKVMKYNMGYEFVISGDAAGVFEYWSGVMEDCAFPAKRVEFSSKLDTDLFDLVKAHATPRAIAFSPDWQRFAVWASDRKMRLFRTSTGKLIKVYDESFTTVTELQQGKQLVPEIEFGRRMAMDRDLEKTDNAVMWGNVVFDETGNFLIYPTPLGIKVVNLVTNNCVRWIGKPENVRFLCLGLFQVSPRLFTESVVLMIFEVTRKWMILQS